MPMRDSDSRGYYRYRGRLYQVAGLREFYEWRPDTRTWAAAPVDMCWVLLDVSDPWYDRLTDREVKALGVPLRAAA